MEAVMRLGRVLTKALFGLCLVAGLSAGAGMARAAGPSPAQSVPLNTATAPVSAPHTPDAARDLHDASAAGPTRTKDPAPVTAASDSSDAASTAKTTERASTGDAASAYVLGTGDKLQINVFGQHNLDGTYLVDGSGNIQFPLIGQIKAAGKTVPQLQDTLTAALSKGFLVNPSVSIEVTSARPFYILGEVKAPGQYPYVMGMSVITAVALAGGYTFRADESDVYIRRAGSDKEKEYRASEKTKVEPGDIIRVPERFF